MINGGWLAFSHEYSRALKLFLFFFSLCSADPKTKRQGSLYIQVEPKIVVTADKQTKEIPLNSIRCQTVLAKCLGPLSTWEKKLLVAKHSGYNFIHFTPVQELGDSRSAYSLQNQLKVNPNFNDNNGKGGKVATFECLEKFIKKMRNEWGVSNVNN